MPRIVVIVPPDPESVLSTAEAKAHLRVAGAGDDGLIEQLVAAVFSHIDGPEGWLGRALAAQTLELRQDCFPRGDAIYLPCEPTRSIVSVTYVDREGAEQVIQAADYRLIGSEVVCGRRQRWPQTYDEPESVRVQYVAGHDPAPPAVVAALKLMLGNLYNLVGPDARLRKRVVEGVGSREWDTTGKFNETADRAVTALLTPLRIFI